MLNKKEVLYNRINNIKNETENKCLKINNNIKLLQKEIDLYNEKIISIKRESKSKIKELNYSFLYNEFKYNDIKKGDYFDIKIDNEDSLYYFNNIRIMRKVKDIPIYFKICIIGETNKLYKLEIIPGDNCKILNGYIHTRDILVSKNKLKLKEFLFKYSKKYSRDVNISKILN